MQPIKNEGEWQIVSQTWDVENPDRKLPTTFLINKCLPSSSSLRRLYRLHS
jgi:hypothetical protein